MVTPRTTPVIVVRDKVGNPILRSVATNKKEAIYLFLCSQGFGSRSWKTHYRAGYRTVEMTLSGANPIQVGSF